MTTVLMEKNGFDDIRVDSTNVTAHEQLGWRKKEIKISSDGQSLVVPDGTVLDFDQGPLSQEIAQTMHYSITPVLNTATYSLAATNLAAGAQDVTSLTNPDVPRTATIKGNVSGITGNVVITGTNFNNAVISDTIALNGTSEVEGIKAFKTLINVHLPARTHTPVLQVETATAAGTVTGSGNATVVVTAAGMTGSPKTISVAVLNNDTASTVAGKIRAALAADVDVSALFTVSGATTAIILTKISFGANDATLNISIDNGTCTGITTAASSANTTAGVAVDTVSVGIGNKFGLPHIVDAATLLQEKVFNGSDDSGTLAVDSDEIEKNLFALNGTPDGAKILDLFYLV